jgi:hypothetical protein
MTNRTKWFVIILSLGSVMLLGILLLGGGKAKPISDFQECVAAGNTVLDVRPRQCIGAGRTFTE